MEQNYFQITASYDKMFGKMFSAAYVRSFHNIIIYSFSVKRVPTINQRGPMSPRLFLGAMTSSFNVFVRVLVVMDGRE